MENRQRKTYPSWQPTAPASQRPYNYPAFSSAPADETMVDPLLEVLKAPALPPLLWDVMTHPNNIKLGSAYLQSAHYLLQSHLARCAARTSMKNSRLPLAKMVLVVPGYPLEVEVTPAAEPLWSDRPLPFVTVGDILYGIYRALRESVNTTEFDRLPRAQRDAMRVAFERRLRSDPANYARNLQTGVRRVDYLGVKRQFIGIRFALGMELPPRRQREETFVVELGRVL
ncbi:hypothetical protein BD413DRAFT_606073 [Trametes elegans]|nr:hypothetical protein BD413DRAFT_606073 [Trametes elegans]